MKKYINVTEAGKILGVTKRTLQRWDREGTLIPFKTKGNHRRYDREEILNYYNNEKSNTVNKDKIVIGYCRVSTNEQTDDLQRQVDNVTNYCTAKGYQFKIIEDIGSGLNYNKKGLKELISLIVNKKVCKIVLNYKDRLVRYGFEIIEMLCEENDIDIEIINLSEDKTFEEELVDDVLSIITVFSAKLYGSRSRKSKKIKDETKKLFNL